MMLSTTLSTLHNHYCDVISQLTAADSFDELLEATHHVFKNHMPDFHFSMVEVTVTRQDGNADKNEILCLPCHGDGEPEPIFKCPDVYAAYCLRTPQITATDNGNRYRLIVPVVLCDRIVSHIINVEHQYMDKLRSIEGIVKIIRDLTRMHRERYSDPLTRTLNRQAMDRFFADVACPVVKPNIARYLVQPLRFIAILDIDHFKQVNDNHGHHIGDEILMLFAQTLRATIRQNDLLFRYGGEEFVLFFCTDTLENGQRILDRCREAIEQQAFPQVKKITVSIGYSLLEEGAIPHIQLDYADKALYYAKSHGRNQVQNYEALVTSEKIPIPAKNMDTQFLS